MQLPGDSLRTIFIYLPRHNIFSCMCVSKHWSTVAQSNTLWSEIFARDFGRHQPSTAPLLFKPCVGSGGYETGSSNTSSGSSDDEQTYAPKPFIPKDVMVQSIISNIVEMGFPLVAAERAWWETKSTNEAAADWLFSHMDDPLIHISPLAEPPKPQPTAEKDPREDEIVQMCTSMFSYSQKSIRVALRLNMGLFDKKGQQAFVEWIMDNPQHMEALNAEYEDDDLDPSPSSSDPEKIPENENPPAPQPMDYGTDFMQKYKQAFFRCLCTKVYLGAPYVKRDNWDSPATVTISTGFQVPPDVPLTFPEAYGTGIFLELDISIVPDDKREAVQFAISYLLYYFQHEAKEPRCLEDIPEVVQSVIIGNTLHVVTFFNPVCLAEGDQSQDGIEFFLKIDKKAWRKAWNPNKNPGSTVSAGEKFLLFLVYKNTKEFQKKQKIYEQRKHLSTTKKRLGGLESNPHQKSRPLTCRVAQMLTQWCTLGHVGMPLLSKDAQQQWDHGEEILEEMTKHKILVNSLRVMNRFGSAGILEFAERPKIKHLFISPPWYRAREESQRYNRLIKIESEIGDFWDQK